LAAVALAALMMAPAARAQDDYAQQDPPDQAGRISAASGTVSIQPSGTSDWGQAYQNLPVAPGDRIYTDQNGWAEVQVGQTYVRIGPNSDITLIGASTDSISWGLAQGGVHVHSFGLWQGQTVNFSTPNGDVQDAIAGELRLDVLPQQNATLVSSLSSQLAVSGAGGYWQQMEQGQALQLSGSNPVYPMWLEPASQDGLDQWSQQRDQQIVTASTYRYVSPGVEGASDLDAYGDWMPDSDYGPMWFPRDVPAGWQPYRYGHWINRDPWGWVWVEDEPWGYAPFHYGRWVTYRGRWGWVPGPREQRPVWSPALVVFAGGIHTDGVSVSAWFPLGPGEAYRPWYHCSPRYIDRVNIANIHESREVHVQKTYVNIVNVTNVTNVTYINRTVGATAMRPEDFAAGRSARQGAVQVDQRQFDRVQVVDRPAPVTRQSFVSRPAQQPVPVAVKTPVFINRQGMQISAKPGAAPQQVPQSHIAPPSRPVQGRTVIAAPQQPQRNPNNGNMQQFGNRQPQNNGNQPQYGNRPQQNNGSQQQSNQPNPGMNNNRPAQQPVQQPVQGQTPQNQPVNRTNTQQPQLPTDARPVGRPVSPINDRGLRQPAQPGANPNVNTNAAPNAGQNQQQKQQTTTLPQQPAQPQLQQQWQQQRQQNQQMQPWQQQQQRQNQQMQQARPGDQPAQQPAAQPQQKPQTNTQQPWQQQNQQQPRPNAQQMQQQQQQRQSQPQTQQQKPNAQPQNQPQANRKDNSNKDQKKDQKKDDKKNDQ